MGKKQSGMIIVAALDENRGIGKSGVLPWRLSGDMAFFKELTTCPEPQSVMNRFGLTQTPSNQIEDWNKLREKLIKASSREAVNTVIMGRKTWESIPGKFRPLPYRHNVVLSRTERKSNESVQMLSDINDASALAHKKGSKNVFVIGGAQLYELVLSNELCNTMYITRVLGDYQTDTFFPEFANFKMSRNSRWIEENGIQYRWEEYLKG